MGAITLLRKEEEDEGEPEGTDEGGFYTAPVCEECGNNTFSLQFIGAHLEDPYPVVICAQCYHVNENLMWYEAEE